MARVWNRLRGWLEETHSSNFELCRHFFLRFFDSEFVSSPEQAKVAAGGALAFLISLFAFYMPPYYHKYRLLHGLPDGKAFHLALLADVLFIEMFTAVVIGIFTTLQWPALFPTLRDYLALASLPTRIRDVFIAKFTALFAFTAQLIVVVTLLPSTILPVIIYGRHSDNPIRQAPGIFVSAACAGLFVFFSLVAFQGLLLNLMPPRAFTRVSLAIQAILLAVLLCALPVVLLTPDLQPWMELRPAWALLTPPLWFLGLDQVIAGNREPMAVRLAWTGLTGVGIAAWAAAMTYLWSYRKHRIRVLESPGLESAGSRRWPERLSEHLLTNRRSLAVFGFTGKSLARSRHHRLVLTGFASVALAVTAEGLVSLFAHHGLSTFSTGAAELREAVIAAPLALSLCCLVGLRYLFRLPVELRANWIFRIHASGHAAELLAGVERFMLYFGVIPVAIASAPIELRVFGVGPGLAAVTLCLLMSIVLVQVLLFTFDKIPFTSSYMPGRQLLALTGLRYLFVAAVYIGGASSLVRWAIEDRVITSVLAFLLTAACWAARAARLSARPVDRLEFAELLEPTVRRLDLDGD